MKGRARSVTAGRAAGGATRHSILETPTMEARAEATHATLIHTTHHTHTHRSAELPGQL